MANNSTNLPFSFQELSTIPEFPLEQPSFIPASDGIKLAYYAFLPQKPSAIIIFYHGGGLYSNRTYQHIGLSLQKDHQIGSYFVDIRGHGNSEGPRGDAPSANQVLEDISTILAMAKTKFPTVPVYLVGHSSGAGLLLNYSAYEHKKAELYDGYILLAPYLGPRVGVERPDAPPFVKSVRVWIYLLNQLFRIPFFQHIGAVFFNYPDELIKQDPLIVTSYSYTMSCATTPNNPALIFEELDKPCTVFIAQDDEQFLPEKIVEFARYNKKSMVTTGIIPQAKHLSILLDGSELIYQAIIKQKGSIL